MGGRAADHPFSSTPFREFATRPFFVREWSVIPVLIVRRKKNLLTRVEWIGQRWKKVIFDFFLFSQFSFKRRIIFWRRNLFIDWKFRKLETPPEILLLLKNSTVQFVTRPYFRIVGNVISILRVQVEFSFTCAWEVEWIGSWIFHLENVRWKFEIFDRFVTRSIPV